jgi:hypothetical protein
MDSVSGMIDLFEKTLGQFRNWKNSNTENIIERRTWVLGVASDLSRARQICN